MQRLHAHPPNALAGSPVDRLDARRRDADWVAAQLAGPNARFLPVWRTRNLVTSTPPRAVFWPVRAAAPWLEQGTWALLGQVDDRILFALDVSATDQPLPPGDNSSFEDIRRFGGLLRPEEASLLAHARGLIHWRQRQRHCGVCGARCTPREAGHVMNCTGCGAQHFPRTDPAVIMLVTHSDRALLGQPAAFRGRRVFTTLAGFVEPGESLEETVAREVREETGVLVGNVCYVSSQPWPFPASVMIGFTAEATTQTIIIDPKELVEAAWFTRESVRSPKDFVLPPDFSIARRLIDGWLES